MTTLQLLRLHLHVSLIYPEGLAQLYIRDEQCELSVKVEEENAEVPADDNPVLTEVPGHPALHSLLVEGAEVDVGARLRRVGLGRAEAGVPWGGTGQASIGGKKDEQLSGASKTQHECNS
jgi:hypothetical protein